MRKTVKTFKLTPLASQTVTAPKGYEFLSVISLDNELHLSLIIDEQQPPVQIGIELYGSGAALTKVPAGYRSRSFAGTLIFFGMVYNVFYLSY